MLAEQNWPAGQAGRLRTTPFLDDIITMSTYTDILRIKSMSMYALLQWFMHVHRFNSSLKLCCLLA
jgi:hypothetical protein